MKLLATRTLLALALLTPALVFATNQVDVANLGGTLTGSSAGLSLTGSSVTAFIGPAGMKTGDLGTLSFATGALLTGSLTDGGTFGGPGSFTITSNGLAKPQFPAGVIFTGWFAGPATWTMTTLADGTHDYSLTGVLHGVWGPTGVEVEGVSVQLTVNTGTGFFTGSGTAIGSGNSDFVGVGIGVVPESTSLCLLGTGFTGLAGIVWRRRAQLRT